MENRRKANIVDQLIKMNFDPDPVKKWREEQKKKELKESGETEVDLEETLADVEEDEVGRQLQTNDWNELFRMERRSIRSWRLISRTMTISLEWLSSSCPRKRRTNSSPRVETNSKRQADNSFGNDNDECLGERTGGKDLGRFVGG